MTLDIDRVISQFNSIDWTHDSVIAAATVVIAVLNIFLTLGTILLWSTTQETRQKQRENCGKAIAILRLSGGGKSL